jgi:chromosome partitioning protein
MSPAPPGAPPVFPAGFLGTIAHPGRKGGQGKTTTAANVGANMALAANSVLPPEDDRVVVVCDADSQRGALTEWFPPQWGDAPPEKRFSMRDVLCGEVSADEATWPTTVPRLYIIPGGPETAGFEQMRMPAQDLVLRGKLAASRIPTLARLIDCGPSLSMVSINGMAAADRIVVAVRVGHLDLIGVSELYGMLTEVREKLVPLQTVAAVVMTDVLRSNLRVKVANRLTEAFPGVPLAEIRHTIRVGEAPASHLPLSLFDPECTAAADYERLTRILYPEVFGGSDA